MRSVSYEIWNYPDICEYISLSLFGGIHRIFCGRRTNHRLYIILSEQLREELNESP